MSKKLAGTLFVRNGVELDYCFEAAIRSLQACCDYVFVLDAGSTDNTLAVLNTLIDGRTTILKCTKEQWEEQQGREKLNFFTNITIQYAQKFGYDYQFNLQADEVIHEDSIPHIRQAVELGEEGYYVTRHNLWADAEHMLNVPQSRKPVSTTVGRLARVGYWSVGDAESIAINGASLDFINKIEIFHAGFIRDNKKHIAKIKEMQKNIFQFENYDSRADLKPEFDWKDWGFTEKDLVKIHKPLPVYVQDWVAKLNK